VGLDKVEAIRSFFTGEWVSRRLWKDGRNHVCHFQVWPLRPSVTI
jgi:hypothetical protein